MYPLSVNTQTKKIWHYYDISRIIAHSSYKTFTTHCTHSTSVFCIFMSISNSCPPLKGEYSMRSRNHCPALKGEHSEMIGNHCPALTGEFIEMAGNQCPTLKGEFIKMPGNCCQPLYTKGRVHQDDREITLLTAPWPSPSPNFLAVLSTQKNNFTR